MKIRYVCPDCNNDSFSIKQEVGFFKKKIKEIDPENYFMQEVICNKCKAVYFIGSLAVGICTEKRDKE